jgi:hypothetical protein
MLRAALLEWDGREYDHNPKSADWYWALGIVAAAGTIALILFGEYLLAVLVIVAASVIAIHVAKVPPLHHFQLVDQGIMIGEELHPFDRMISFSMLEDIEDKLPPLLSIKNESWLSPHLMIPLEGVDADRVYEHFLRHVDEVAHQHTFSDLVAAWLGF